MNILWGCGLLSLHTIFISMLKDQCNKEKLKLNHTPLEDFTNCLWQKQPRVLPIWIAYRVALFLYFLITFGVMVFHRPEEGFIWFKNIIYFAYWSYLVEVLAFGLACAVSVEKFVKDKKAQEATAAQEETEYRSSDATTVTTGVPWHFKTLWCAYTMAASSSLAVTTMFWLFFYNPKVYESLAFSIVTRIFNSVFLVVDIFLNGIPFRFLHMYIPAAFFLGYAIFTVIYQFSGGTGNRGQIPIYNIMDWREPKQAMATLSIATACIVLFHCGMCVLNMLKNWLKKPSE